MKRLKHYIFLAISMILIITCQDEEIDKREYPRLRTHAVTEISETGATFVGEIVSTGNSEIVEYGFVWSDSGELSTENSAKYIVGDIEIIGEYTKAITFDLAVNKTYYVKSYARTNKFIVYGELIEFLSLGSKSPDIVDFYPDIASWGDTITIYGENFSALKENTTIKFGDFNSAIVSTTDSVVRCIVPNELNEYSSIISLSVLGNISYGSSNFTLTPQNITSVSCDSAVFDAPIEIVGNHFKENMTSVLFGTMESEIDEINSNYIKTRVPANLNGEELDFIVKVAGNSITYKSKFKSLVHEIINVEPDSASFGDEIIIIGKNFNPILEHNNLYLDDIRMDITHLSSDSIKFIVPNTIGKSNGEFDLGITVGGITEIYENKFVLKAPQINSFTPANVNYGDTVIVTGENFNPILTLNQLFLNDRELNLLEATNSRLKFIIPFDLLDEIGEFSLKVITGEQQDIYASKLKVKSPVITSLSSTNVVVGDTLTIYGNNFNPDISYTSLLIGGIDLEIVSSDYDRIQFIVPLEIELSNNLIKLIVNLQETQSPETVSLLVPVINSITPSEGYRGIEIKLIGNNFSINKEFNKVYFNSDEVSLVRSNHDTIVVEIKDIIDEGLKDVKVEIGTQSSLLSSCYTQIEPWKTKTPTEGYYSKQYYAPLGGVGTSYNGYGYAGLRSDLKTPRATFGSSSYKSFYKYSSASDSWTSLAEFPNGGAENLISYRYNDSLYVVYLDNELHKVWRYSFNDDAWKLISNYSSDGTDYIYGFGFNENIYLMSYGGEIICYDILNDLWTNKQDSPFNPKQTQGTEHNNKVFMLGTEDHLWEYDPGNDTWQDKGNVPFINISSSSPMLKLNDEFYYFTLDKRIYKYNPMSGLWFIASSKSPKPRYSDYYHIFYKNYYFKIDNMIYISMFNLQDCCYYKVYEYFYEYDPSKDIFTEITP